MQERRKSKSKSKNILFIVGNSFGNALELRISFTNPLIYCQFDT